MDVMSVVNLGLDALAVTVGSALLLAWLPVAMLLRLVRSFRGSAFSMATHDRVVIITGAASGIGEAIAYEYAKLKSILVLVDIDEDLMKGTASNCVDLGAASIFTFQTDVAHAKHCRAVVDETINELGRIDVLVLNAGVDSSWKFEEAKNLYALKRPMDVNFGGYVWMTMAALPYLMKSKGHILFNSSIESFTPVPRHAVYNASKTAVTMFFDSLIAENAAPGVHISNVLPGAVQSLLTSGHLLDPSGKMVVDQGMRNRIVGPQPMLSAATCGHAFLEAELQNLRYRIVPFWTSAFLLFRLFAPSVLFSFLRGQYMFRSSLMGGKTQAEYSLEDMGMQKFMFYPPATSQQEAERAVKGEGKTKIGMGA